VVRLNLSSPALLYDGDVGAVGQEGEGAAEGLIGVVRQEVLVQSHFVAVVAVVRQSSTLSLEAFVNFNTLPMLFLV
jgi:hypothetical protein